MNLRVAVETRDSLGESVFWHAGEQALYWIDFYGPVLHRWNPVSGVRNDWTIPGSQVVGSAVPANNGRVLLALDSGLHVFDPEDGSTRFFADPNGGRPGIGYNDAKVDRAGRYWIGTYDTEEREPRGILYCVASDGTASVADSGYMVCNGPAFSPKGRILYFSDTAGSRLLAYDLDLDTGRPGKARLFSRISADDGLPDGLTVDREGFLWCAHYGGGRVTRFAPDGDIDRTIELPVPYVTSCCFGGPSLETLYITTARSGMDTAALTASPSAGALFAIEPGVQGLPDRVFSVD
jgi:sugar lactone lactonase YvrE